MQNYKLSYKGQNVYVGIDVHLKTWYVTAITETGYKESFGQRSDAKVLFDTLNRKFPHAHFKSAYEAGFCGFSVHYRLTEQGFGIKFYITAKCNQTFLMAVIRNYETDVLMTDLG